MQHQLVVEVSPVTPLHDPLSFNLNRQTTVLLSSIPRTSVDYDAIVGASSTSHLLIALSSALENPCLTTIVAKLFRPLLMDLCSRWIDDSENSEKHLVALSYLVEVHEELFPVLHRVLIKHFEGGPLGFLSSLPSLESVNIVRLHQLLLAYYRILQINRELPQYFLWPLAPLARLIESGLDHGIHFIAIRCYSLQSGMGEAERIKVERSIIGEPFMNDFSINIGQYLDGTTKEVDGWMLPVIELRRVREEREEMMLVEDFYFQEQANEVVANIQDSDLSPWVINVCGVLMLRSSVLPPPISSFVHVPSSIEALQVLALHVSLRLPTILTSVPSGGKTLILSHLAKLVHPGHQNQIVTVQLADTSLDPRSLLGSYVSSTVHPGTFEWRDGTLIRCMREGKWVVFKDIDRGSPEILGVVKPLVESLELGKWIGGRAKLDVPSHGTVVAHDSFRLFSTRSSLPSKDGVFPSLTFFGSHRFSEVFLRAPSPSELNSVVSVIFPRLAGNLAQVIIQVWEGIRQMGPSVAGRDVGLKELLKFCRRIDALLLSSDILMEGGTLTDMFPNPSIREDIFMEARDIFFGFGTPTPASHAHCEAVARLVGQYLGLDLERQRWILIGKLPQLEIEKDSNGRTTAVRAGRTCILKSLDKSANSTNAARPFTMHKPAVCLISRIATAVSHSEPVLLTGETGTGKTSVITHLASLLHQRLISLNLSHQTESSDLIGGLKPIDARIPAAILQEKFVSIFGATFSRRKNEKFETEIRKAVNDCKWKRTVGLWKESVRLAVERIQAKEAQSLDPQILDDHNPRKRRKTEVLRMSAVSWTDFLHEVEEFEARYVLGKGKFTFGFVEGPLVRALRAGYWVLLDEINLAAPETLESISSLLQDPTSSITLTEHGSLVPVPRHPNFRLFACMNPATDVGKKDLPLGIRSRFTEIDVQPPDADKDTLLSIIAQYIGHAASGDKKIIMDVAEFYIAVKQVAETRQIADGANHQPHFSMRTLTRALTFASDTVSTFSLRRSVWEGCLMAFTMTLDIQSAESVTNLAKKHLLSGVRNAQSMLVKEPTAPSREGFVKFGPFYLEQGPLEPDSADDYIITTSVAQKLCDISRIILTRRFPVLIEGPTSSGKTSSIEYLARRTGHKFVRINNHEHTDIQEYVGCYVSDPITGKLIYKDGLLLQALRFGHWIVLDELNLAPTDVLEALNRLLDDNRELVVPETQEVVRPHPHFMLFATQNPPGLYAGRKILSRAFRSRFLEVHFNDVPQDELETILCQKCRIAPSYSKRIINVFRELQKRRQTSRVFESKHGFATLRDLFRWGNRDAVGYQELADNGYMLLAERARRSEDKAVVKEVLENEMGVKINEDALYNSQRIDIDSFLGCPIPRSADAVWTKALQRLYTLVCRALKFQEPVLLVGETGTGKTSICQIFAEASSQPLLTLNCHQNLETADIIGGMRPVRNRSVLQADAIRNATVVLKDIGLEPSESDVEHLTTILYSASKSESHGSDPQLRYRLQDAYERLSRSNSIFEWRDGPLIDAMRNGGVFLMDEISLADDSILERLNSVLEHGRSIVLAERGGADSDNTTIQADKHFRLIATMNPGGDYGKKELSPALRNRFTEIWVPPIDDRQDLELVVNSCWSYPSLRSYTHPLLDFIDWLCLRVGDQSLLSLRDIIAWVGFVNTVYDAGQSVINNHLSDQIFHHGANMTYLDGLGSFPQLASFSRQAIGQIKSDGLKKLQDLVPLSQALETAVLANISDSYLQIGPFAIPKGSLPVSQQSFNFAAPTTLSNALRVIRACQVTKPILLEGSPGVGKTSLIIALANLSGHNLCRINLSDQTDLSDLFGSDLPVEGGVVGEFAWKDAEFLKALQEGYWVLLDEMNLASQAVLEGLNAVLDHRGTVYIPELKRSFKRHPSFRIFAAQNPLHQGSGRKGLPKSFLNRFTKVYVEELTHADFHTACSELFPQLEKNSLRSMISFNIGLSEKVSARSGFALDGSPWEFNLRDVIRWATLVSTNSGRQPEDYLRVVYLDRFRSLADRKEAISIFNNACSVLLSPSDMLRSSPWSIDSGIVQFGTFLMARQNRAFLIRPRRVLHKQLNALESLGLCVSQSWLAILTGPRSSGKTSLVRSLAHLTGNVLREMTINPGTDTMDILGSFEQLDNRRTLSNILDEVIAILEASVCTSSGIRRTCIDQHIAYSLRHDCDKVSTSELPTLIQDAFNLISTVFALDSSPRNGTSQDTLRRLMETPFEAGRFEWIDGPLIHAMKHGQWILLEGANLCNPSVLDRLNSLCEDGGCLTLSERGFVGGEIQTIKPHPNFRLFMTVDPQHGELSRAMRNRGVEIFLDTGYSGNDTFILQDFYRLPLYPLAHFNREQGVTFEAIRRGMLFQKSSIAPAISTGRSLDQDSALAYLVDAVPALLSRHQKSDNPGPWIFFLSRSLVPANMPCLLRYLKTVRLETILDPILQNFLQEFPDEKLSEVLMIYRQDYSLQRKISFDAVLAQPMNFYSCEVSARTQIGTLSPTHVAQSAVLEILNLSSALFIQGTDIAQIHDLDKLNDKQRLLIEAVERLLVQVRDTALLLMGMLRVSTCALDSARLALIILSNTSHLRTAIKTSSYDFSVLYGISSWLRHLLGSCDPLFTDIIKCVDVLHNAVSPSNGVGLLGLWSCLFIEECSSAVLKMSTWTDQIASSLNDFPGDAAIRLQLFNLMSLETFPPSLASRNCYRQSLSELRSKLNEYLNSRISDMPFDNPRNVGPQLSILELNILSLSYQAFESKNINAVLQGLIALTSNEKGSSLLRLTSLQHLAWILEGGAVDQRILIRAQINWMEGLWNTRLDDKICGPSVLLRPVMLRQVIQICNMDEVQLCDLLHYEEVIRLQARTSLIVSGQPADRFTQLARVFFGTLVCVTSPYMSSYDSDIAERIKGITFNDGDSFLASLCHALSLLQRTTDGAFAAALNSELFHLINPQPSPNSLQLLALAWIGVGRLIFHLTVPDIPLDPMVVEHVNYSRVRREEADLSAQIHLHEELESLVTGNMQNNTTLHLKALLSQLQSQPNSSKAPHRQDIPRLHLFWSEIVQFKDTVLSSEKVQSLLDGLLMAHQDSFLRERVFQESLAGFFQRCDIVHPEFLDMTIIFKLAGLSLRLGVRMLLDSTLSVGVGNSTVKMHDPLVLFPSVYSSFQLIRTFDTIQPSSNAISQHILLALAASAAELSLGAPTAEILPIVETAYEQAVGLWLIDRVKKREWNKETSTLYRSGSVSDAQNEEEDFLAIFPTFEDAFEPETSAANKQYRPPTSRIQVKDSVSLLQIHFALTTTCGSSHPKNPFDTLRKLKIETVQDLLQGSPEILSDAIDHAGRHLQLILLYENLKHFTTSTNNDTYNFYEDANYPQLRRASSIMTGLRRRLQSIANEWPDQMVLKHLVERCDLILNISATSPLAKVLVMVEKLLVQTDDWEAYSNRENSIKAERDELIALIIDWRRSELACWQTLLEAQSTAFVDEMSDWWFHLYDALVRGALASQECAESDGEPQQSYLDSLIPLLDDFMKGGPLGQFHARLQLLGSFERYTEMIIPLKTPTDGKVLQVINRVIHATYSYYSLYSESLLKHLQEQRRALQKEVEGFIKLASWKDVNVEALRQSSKKTHQQLYKIIRKFREVLRQPVCGFLQPYSSGGGEGLPLRFDVATLNQPEDSNFQSLASSEVAHSLRLRTDHQGAHDRLYALIMDHIKPSIRSYPADIVDDIAIEIITTSTKLAEYVVPSSLSGKLREKHINSLQVRKRKAWSDLLKELKRSGLSSNVKPEILRRNASSTWVRQQPIIPKASAINIDIDKGEIYFNKLCGSLSLLRDTLSSHHSDLSIRELQRGVAFLECGFAMAVDLRVHLCSALEATDQMQRALRRLKTLSHEDIFVVCAEPRSHVFSLSYLLCKIGHAMLEVHGCICIANDLGLDPPATLALLEEILAAVELTRKMRGHLQLLLADLGGLDLPFLLPSEYDIVTQAERLRDQVIRLASDWLIQHPMLHFLFNPLLQWLREEVLVPLQICSSTSGSTPSQLEELIDSLRDCVQRVASRCSSDDKKEESNKYLLDGYLIARDLTGLMRLGDMKDKIVNTFSIVSSYADAKECLLIVTPFLDLYVSLALDQISALATWTKALFKLNFVLCSLMRSLCQNGFCRPAEIDTNSGPNAETSDTAEGTGIGDGSGGESISKEIEDESQIEGLQDTAEEDVERKNEADADAIEMADDFGGELEDMSEVDGDDRSSLEESEFDETLGDIDVRDPSAVNEKIRDDSQPPANSDGHDGRIDEKRSTKQTELSEVMAKDGEDTKKAEDLGEVTQEDSIKEEIGLQDEQNTDPFVDGAPMEQVPDADSLDLPENVNLDDKDEMNGEHDVQEDCESFEDQSVDLPEDMVGDDMDDRLSPSSGLDNDVDDQAPGRTQPEPGEAKCEENEIQDTIASYPDISPGDGKADAMDDTNSESGEPGSGGNSGYPQNKGDDKLSTQEEEDHDVKSSDASQTQQPTNASPAGNTGPGNVTSGVEQGQVPSGRDERPITNPMRSLGDALNDIRRRFDEILEASLNQKQVGEPRKETRVEHLRPEDTDGDMQALGPAGDEQVAQLNELRFVDDEMEVDQESAAMLVDDDPTPEHQEPSGSKHAEQLESPDMGQLGRATLPLSHQGDEKIVFVTSGDEKASEDEVMEDIGRDLELELQLWKNAGHPEENAQQIWQRYEGLTHDLAYALCEQLRLILEPTLATRLKGDYRSGKRLNMKKVIAYIASDFTKDKIWLRRTKPSQREYQVLISLDDSRSMSDSHCIHLAFQTLALISKALSRLESGDIAIAKFGETVEIIRGLDEGPFTERVGTDVINAFRFSQKATNVLSLMERTLIFLESARERKAMTSATATELWQLQIIISDGVCQDHDKLRAVLRKAEEQRVMVVFIILDSMKSISTESVQKNFHSILEMKKVDFKVVEGRMELQHEKYLDSFPFNYYVVLRNVENLPDVLGETLKQFFEKISER